MTYFDQDRRYNEDEPSYRDDHSRFGERGPNPGGRWFERGPDAASLRDFGRGAERDTRGGTRHHSSRPYLSRETETERDVDDYPGRQLGGMRAHHGDDAWSSHRGGASRPYQEAEWRRGPESRAFGQDRWSERGASGDSGGYRPGGFGGSFGGNLSSEAFGGSSYGGFGQGGSGYGGSSYGSGVYGGEYGAGVLGRHSERGHGQRSWQGSGPGSQGGEQGPYVGKGPKGYKRSDERLNEATCDCLERNGQLDASGIEVTCKDGTVTLRGTVDSRRAKRLAEETAESVYGVQDVMNELRVQKDSSDSSASSATQSERTSATRQDESRQASALAGQSASTTSAGQKR